MWGRYFKKANKLGVGGGDEDVVTAFFFSFFIAVVFN